MTDQAARLREMVTTTARRTNDHALTIAITGGKGGVGKTTCSLMLGIALAGMGKKVAVVDADLGLANIHIMLGLAPRFNLAHLATGECSLEDIVCKGPAGIDIIPGASGIESLANISAERAARLIEQLRLLEQTRDIIIIDTAAGVADITMRFAAPAGVTICIVTPDPASLADAYATIKILMEHGARQIKVLVNRVASEKEGRAVFDKLHALVIKFLKNDIAFLGALFNDHELGNALIRQRIITIDKPQGVMSCRIRTLAQKLCGMPVVRSRESFFGRILGGNGDSL